MGLDSIWHWLLLLVIILVIFGTGKLTKIGPDLGKAMRGFKKALHEDESDEAKRAAADQLRADPPPAPDGVTQGQGQHDASKTK